MHGAGGLGVDSISASSRMPLGTDVEYAYIIDLSIGI